MANTKKPSKQLHDEELAHVVGGIGTAGNTAYGNSPVGRSAVGAMMPAAMRSSDTVVVTPCNSMTDRGQPAADPNTRKETQP